MTWILAIGYLGTLVGVALIEIGIRLIRKARAAALRQVA